MQMAGVLVFVGFRRFRVRQISKHYLDGICALMFIYDSDERQFNFNDNLIIAMMNVC